LHYIFYLSQFLYNPCNMTFSDTMSRKKHKKKHRQAPRESPREGPSKSPSEAPKESSQEAPKQPAREGPTPGPAGSEESQSRLSILIYTAAAIAMGYASLMVSPMAGNMLTILLGLIAAWLVSSLVQHFVGQKGIKWLIGNGLFIYLFAWLVAWIFFFNLLG